MTTPRDLIKASLELLSVIDPIEDVDSDEISGLFARLNRMLASWSTVGALVYADTLVEHTLIGNDGVYTIGSGADINTTRPIEIKTAYVRDGSTDHPIEIIDEYAYSQISDKTTAGSYPEKLYYNPDFPTGTIKLYPVPGSAYTLFLETRIPLTSFTGLSQTISLPPGYEEAIEYNFAKRIAPVYARPVPMEVDQIATESLNNIKRANRNSDSFEADLGIPTTYSRYDIYGDRS